MGCLICLLAGCYYEASDDNPDSVEFYYRKHPETANPSGAMTQNLPKIQLVYKTRSARLLDVDEVNRRGYVLAGWKVAEGATSGNEYLPGYYLLVNDSMVFEPMWEFDSENFGIWASDEIPFTEDFSFLMIPVPAKGFSAPYSQSNPYKIEELAVKMDHDFYLGETEVPWILWKTIYDWATDLERDEDKRYTFARKGQAVVFTNPKETEWQLPATGMGWNDMAVFCNALTEWHNETYGTNYQPAYVTVCNDVIRTSVTTNNKVIPYDMNVVLSKSGFRLPESTEWNFAARYVIDGTTKHDVSLEYTNLMDCVYYAYPFFITANSVSGATVAVNAANPDPDIYAVANLKPLTGPAIAKPVGDLRANDLGFKDMSGNVLEMCNNNFINMGHAYISVPGSGMLKGNGEVSNGTNNQPILGFRLCRTL